MNESAAQLFGSAASELEDTDVLAHVHPDERDAARLAYAAVTNHVIDGYQVTRRIIRSDGSETALTVWGRRLDAFGGRYGLWILLSASDELGEAATPTADFVLALTDHDWQLDYVSSNAHLIGGQGSRLVGLPILGFIHPSVAVEFLEAAARSVAQKVAISLVTRLRVGRALWRDRYCVIVPMCEHSPPRLGLVITDIPSEVAGPTGVIGREVRQSAIEARAAKALGALPAIAHHSHMPELSSRQIEIPSMLIAGDDVEEIANALFLSRSTVRNHLTAIYKKFGVHSQTELLATLLRTTRPAPGEVPED